MFKEIYIDLKCNIDGLSLQLPTIFYDETAKLHTEYKNRLYFIIFTLTNELKITYVITNDAIEL